MPGESEDLKMKKYEVWATVWNDKLRIPEWICIGSFDKYFNASLFAQAYSNHFSTTVDIFEFKHSDTHKINCPKV